MTHTSGSWEAKGDWIYAHNGMTPVADCDVGARSRKERVADARLIAAAPDLLALALQYRDDLRHPPTADSITRRIAAIDAAIAKATGQQEG